MMWETPVPIFEDEDEAELITRFVELSARYPDREPFEITGHIFKNLREPTLRAGQAAMVWSKDLDIIERIRHAKLNGGSEPNPIDTKEAKLRKLEAIYNNEDNNLRERLKALELHAEMQGEIKKPAESGDKENDKPRVPIVMNFGIDPRSQHAA